MSSGEPEHSGGPAEAPQNLDWLNGDIAALRAEYEKMRARPVPVGAEWLEVQAVDRTIKVLAHGPSGAGGVAIVYFHGGGFIVGWPLTHADITEALWRETSLPLFSVDYRLAPDHTSPAPAEDGVAVVNYLSCQGFDGFLLCGDSAGGAIALAIEATASDELRAKIRGVCSLYGAYGILDSPTLRSKGSRIDGTDAACIKRYFNLADGWNAYSLSSLVKSSAVPVYLVAAGDDPLLEDSLQLAERLRQYHRDLSLEIVMDVGHGFMHRAGASVLVDKTIRSLANWMLSVSR